MKTIKVSEATNTQLDWLVARCEGFAVTLLTVSQQRDRWARDAKTTEEKDKLLAEWDEYFACTAKPEIRILDSDGYKRLPYLGSEIEMPRSKSGGPEFQYTTNPAQMWPIIEREGISTLAPTTYYLGPERHPFPIPHWRASKQKLEDPTKEDGITHAKGATSLIAATRCYVMSKLGMIVEVPKELV